VVHWSEILAANPGRGFDVRRYQIVCVAVGVERGPLSLVRINEELFQREVAAPVQKTEINNRGISAALTTQHSCIHKSGTKFR
jgi:hypothetical protein